MNAASERPDHLRTLKRGVDATCIVLLAFYFFLVLLQVLFRYVLNESLFWSEELIRNSLIWMVMLGSALVAARREHIRIDMLEGALSGKRSRLVKLACDSLSITFCLILAWQGIELVVQTHLQTLSVLDLPKWTVYAAIPCGAFLECLFTLDAWRRGTLRGAGGVVL